MSFTGPLTQEDLWAPKILVAVEKGKKNQWYSEAKALLLQPGKPQQMSGELTLPSKLREVKHRQLHELHSPQNSIRKQI